MEAGLISRGGGVMSRNWRGCMIVMVSQLASPVFGSNGEAGIER